MGFKVQLHVVILQWGNQAWRVTWYSGGLLGTHSKFKKKSVLLPWKARKIKQQTISLLVLIYVFQPTYWKNANANFNLINAKFNEMALLHLDVNLFFNQMKNYRKKYVHIM